MHVEEYDPAFDAGAFWRPALPVVDVSAFMDNESSNNHESEAIEVEELVWDNLIDEVRDFSNNEVVSELVFEEIFASPAEVLERSGAPELVFDELFEDPAVVRMRTARAEETPSRSPLPGHTLRGRRFACLLRFSDVMEELVAVTPEVPAIGTPGALSPPPPAPPLPHAARSASDPLPPIAAIVPAPERELFCDVCASMFPISTGFHCVMSHACCGECMAQYIAVKVSERLVRQIRCPSHGCTCLVSEITIEKLLAEAPDVLKSYKRVRAKAANPNLVECPTCDELVSGNPGRPNMACTACKAEFCFHHALAHPGKKCPVEKVSLAARVGNAWWRMRHTRTCPSCKNSIEKNGGCNHMTCRCGFEICWKCGDPYEKNGRRGHVFKYFPSPSELRYCCNDSKQWAARVGLFVGAVPLAAAGAALFVAGYPIFKATTTINSAVKHIKRKRAIRQRERRNRLEHAELMASPESQFGMCLRHYESAGMPHTCLSCNQRTTCTHSFPISAEQFPGADMNMCMWCGHYRHNGCDHYYSADHLDNCVFCGAARPHATAVGASAPPAPPAPPMPGTEAATAAVFAARQARLRVASAVTSRRRAIEEASSGSEYEVWSDDEELSTYPPPLGSTLEEYAQAPLRAEQLHLELDSLQVMMAELEAAI